MDYSLSRTYLESLTSADLVSLAEKYNIDVPENLNRRFIIGELLDMGINENGEDEIDSSDFSLFPTGDFFRDGICSLPESYSETSVTAIFRHPVWLYAYWDFSIRDWERIRKTPEPSLSLRVQILDEAHRTPQAESFITPLFIHDRDEHVHLPPGKKIVRLELIFGDELLAVSSEVHMPHHCPLYTDAISGEPLPPLLELSGFRDLCHRYYLNHRQSLSMPER
jgi:hypothetical protein